MKKFTAKDLDPLAALLADITADSPAGLPTTKTKRRRETCCETTWRLVLSAGQYAVENPGKVLVLLLLASTIIPAAKATPVKKASMLDIVDLGSITSDIHQTQKVVNDLIFSELYSKQTLPRERHNVDKFFIEFFLVQHQISGLQDLSMALAIGAFKNYRKEKGDLNQITDLTLLTDSQADYNYIFYTLFKDLVKMPVISRHLVRIKHYNMLANLFIINKKLMPWSDEMEGFIRSICDNETACNTVLRNAEKNEIQYEGFFRSFDWNDKSNTLSWRNTIRNYYELLEKPEELHILMMLFEITLSDSAQFKILFEEYAELYQHDFFIKNKNGRHIVSARYELFKAYIEHRDFFDDDSYFKVLHSQGVILSPDDERRKMTGSAGDYHDQLDTLKLCIGAHILYQEWMPTARCALSHYEMLSNALPEKDLISLPYYDKTELKKSHQQRKKKPWYIIYSIISGVTFPLYTFFRMRSKKPLQVRKIQRAAPALDIMKIKQKVSFLFNRETLTSTPILFQSRDWNTHQLTELRLTRKMKSLLQEFIKNYLQKNHKKEAEHQKLINFHVDLTPSNLCVNVIMTLDFKNSKTISFKLDNEPLWRNIITHSKEHKDLEKKEEKRQAKLKRQTTLVNDLKHDLQHYNSKQFDTQYQMIINILKAYDANAAHQTRTLDKSMSHFQLYLSKSKSATELLSKMLDKSVQAIWSDEQYNDYWQEIKGNILPDLRHYFSELPNKLSALKKLLKNRYRDEPISTALLKFLEPKTATKNAASPEKDTEYEKHKDAWREQLKGLSIQESNTTVVPPKKQVKKNKKDTTVELVIHNRAILTIAPKQPRKLKTKKPKALQPTALEICENLRIQIQKLASIIDNEMVNTPEAISYHLIRILRQSCIISKNEKMQSLSNKLIHHTQYELVHSKNIDSLKSLLKKISKIFIDTANEKFNLADFDKKIAKQPKLRNLVSQNMKTFFNNEKLVDILVVKLIHDKSKWLDSAKDKTVVTNAYLTIIQKALPELLKANIRMSSPGYQLFYANAIGEAWQSILKQYSEPKNTSFKKLGGKLQKSLGLSENAIKTLNTFRRLKIQIGHYTQQDAMLLKMLPNASEFNRLKKELQAMPESKSVLTTMAPGAS